MKIYISSSWKNRDDVRRLAIELRQLGQYVYDFTDSNCRQAPEIPPEIYPELFDPVIHQYSEYICRPEWKAPVDENRRAIEWADLIILLLPCGNGPHAEWALGVGLGKNTIVVGKPCPGDRSPVHNWANKIFDSKEEFIDWLLQAKAYCDRCGRPIYVNCESIFPYANGQHICEECFADFGLTLGLLGASRRFTDNYDFYGLQK